MHTYYSSQWFNLKKLLCSIIFFPTVDYMRHFISIENEFKFLEEICTMVRQKLTEVCMIIFGYNTIEINLVCMKKKSQIQFFFAHTIV